MSVNAAATSYTRSEIAAALAEAKRLVSRHIADGGKTRAYIDRNDSRILDSVQRVIRNAGESTHACEVGFGPIGLTYHLLTGRPVTGFDLVDLYRELCVTLGIPLHKVDLRTAGPLGPGTFDLVMMFEVIEHIDRPPAQICSDLRAALRAGGRLMLSTVNLTRLLNRLRLAAGRPLFADYDPALLIMAHFREYTREELERYVTAAGFRVVRSEYYVESDPNRPSLYNVLYRGICAAYPPFSNVIFVDAEAA